MQLSESMVKVLVGMLREWELLTQAGVGAYLKKEDKENSPYRVLLSVVEALHRRGLIRVCTRRGSWTLWSLTELGRKCATTILEWMDTFLKENPDE